jgi:hypothetical protein
MSNFGAYSHHWSGWIPGIGGALIGVFLGPFVTELYATKRNLPNLQLEIRGPVHDFQDSSTQELIVVNNGSGIAKGISIRIDNQLPSLEASCDGEQYETSSIIHAQYPLIIRQIRIERLAPRTVFTCTFKLSGAAPIEKKYLTIIADEEVLSEDHIRASTKPSHRVVSRSLD